MTMMKKRKWGKDKENVYCRKGRDLGNVFYRCTVLYPCHTDSRGWMEVKQCPDLVRSLCFGEWKLCNVLRLRLHSWTFSFGSTSPKKMTEREGRMVSWETSSTSIKLDENKTFHRLIIGQNLIGKVFIRINQHSNFLSKKMKHCFCLMLFWLKDWKRRRIVVLGGISWFDPGFEAVSRTLDPKINKCCKIMWLVWTTALRVDKSKKWHVFYVY